MALNNQTGHLTSHVEKSTESGVLRVESQSDASAETIKGDRKAEPVYQKKYALKPTSRRFSGWMATSELGEAWRPEHRTIIQQWAYHFERVMRVTPPKAGKTGDAGEQRLFSAWCWMRGEEAIAAARKESLVWANPNVLPPSLVESNLRQSLLLIFRDGISLSDAATWPMGAVTVRKLPAMLDELVKANPWRIIDDC